MKRVVVRSGAWYVDRQHELEFPDDWVVWVAAPKGARPLSDAEVEEAFNSPVGTPRIRDLARGKRSAVLITDDISRPTPVHRLIPFVLRELREGGINDDQVRIVIATGGHRPQVRDDLVKKLGETIIDQFEVLSHHPFDNLAHLGTTSRGTPIYVNRLVMSADLKIGIGSITRHGGAGFGGGAKIVLPGVAGAETIVANHSMPFRGVGVIEGNELRADIEEVADRAGLDVVVNTVLSPYREIAAVFVGHFVQAHRAAVAVARTAYATKLWRGMDVVVANAYPMDTDLFQSEKSLWPGPECVRPGGHVLLLAEAPEGKGHQAFYQQGCRMYTPPDEDEWRTRFAGASLGVVSQNLNPADLWELFPRTTRLFRSWSAALQTLLAELGAQTDVKVAVFPCAPLQLQGS